jgi:hypothetical protein
MAAGGKKCKNGILDPKGALSFERTVGLGAGTVVGGFLVAFSQYQRARLRASETWHNTPGTIVTSTVREAAAPEGANYYASLTYNYEVGGRRYVGTKIDFAKRKYAWKNRAQEDVDRYPANKVVTVYFDPNRPSDAVLVRDYPDNTVFMISGIVILLIVIVVWLWG